MKLKYGYFIFSNIKPGADSSCNQMSFGPRELLDKFFTFCWAHTHLQQPDVAWSQPWEPVKHF